MYWIVLETRGTLIPSSMRITGRQNGQEPPTQVFGRLRALFDKKKAENTKKKVLKTRIFLPREKKRREKQPNFFHAVRA